MPANSGAITGTIAHKHSAPSADGGFLDDNVTGVTGTALGDLIYFDGSSIAQSLTIGGAGDTLGIAGGVPAWVTPATGSAVYEQVGNIELTVNTNTIGLTFAAISGDDVASLEVFYGGHLTASSTACIMKINNESGANYTTQYSQVSNGTGSTFENASATSIATSPASRQIYGHVSLQAGTTAQAAATDTFIQYMGTQAGRDDYGITNFAGVLQIGGASPVATEITQFDIEPNSGFFSPGFFLTIYKINRT